MTLPDMLVFTSPLLVGIVAPVLMLLFLGSRNEKVTPKAVAIVPLTYGIGILLTYILFTVTEETMVDPAPIGAFICGPVLTLVVTAIFFSYYAIKYPVKSDEKTEPQDS